MYDYDQNPEPHTPPEQKSNGMETAAMILGILGIVGSACCYLAIPFGAIGILLAILSRGKSERMSNRARLALWLSAGSLILTVSLTGYTLYRYRDVFSSEEFQQKIREYLEYYNSSPEKEDSDDFLEDFFNDRENNGNAVPDGDDFLDDFFDDYAPYGVDPYGDSSPYVNGPSDGYWGTTPYRSSPGNEGYTVPGPEI